MKKPEFGLFLLVQLILFFIGIGFSSGGGNQPGTEANNLIYLKAIFLFTPVFSSMVAFLLNPAPYKQAFGLIVSLNRYYLFYLLACVVMLPFAVVVSYSAARLFFTIAPFISLLSLMIQYHVKDIAFEKHMVPLGLCMLLLPVYVIFSFGLDNFRNNLQSLLLVHPNILAAFYAHFLMLFACLAVIKPQAKFIIPGLIFLIAVTSLFSRSVLINLGLTSIAVAVYLYFKIHSLNALLYLFGTFFIGISTSALVFSGLIHPEDILGLIARNNDIESLFTLTNRSILWMDLFHHTEWPVYLTGNGYSVIDRDFGVRFGSAMLFGAHNAYFSILLGSGIMALLPFLCHLARLSRYVWTSPISGLSCAVFSSLVFFMLNCLFSEEAGISLSVTFAYLTFASTLFLTRQKT